MEKGKQQGGNSKSSSTFTNDLFGPIDSSSSSIFGSVFGPASTGLRRDTSHNSVQAGWSLTHDSEYKDIQGKRGNNNGGNNKERSPITSQNGVGCNNNDACYFNSSIYYGGQQVYSPNNTTNQTIFKGDDGKYDDSNGNNPTCEARGNWWQGSFHY
ncbi:hypothetical protein Leryth_007450 [Lithospermum erythrorhizon]|uniref:Uncharacterized protein n=1 Tax=Lithospermum erythrorhizon TaxID=34254 RepID=A0AAV3NR96_LITER|nr:hypothetical protein Leryth_007450 [Lithospermum erythrorhizon]